MILVGRDRLFTSTAVSGILSAWIPVHIVSLNLLRASGRYGGTDCSIPCATWGASPLVQWSRALPSPSPSANLVGVSGRDNTYGFHVIPESRSCLVGSECFSGSWSMPRLHTSLLVSPTA